MALKALAVIALETACMIAALVKALVDRPKQAATVKGFRRYAMLSVEPSSP